MRTIYFPILAAMMIAVSACSSDSQSMTGPGGASTHSLSGTVISSAQPYTVISNARIEVTSGADVGRFTQSDSGGLFKLTSISDGAVSVTITKAGYMSTLESVNLSADTAIFPKLTPMQ